MALVQNPQGAWLSAPLGFVSYYLTSSRIDVSAFSGGSIGPNIRRSVSRTWSQQSIPESRELNVSVHPSPTPQAQPTASSTEVKTVCDSPDDLSNGKLQRVLDLAEHRLKHTLEKAELTLRHTNVDPSPVYRQAVHADRFPALHSLHIAGFFPTTATMHTFHHLRCLRLYNFYRNLEETLMSLHDFVVVLGTWTQLEELELRGYSPALEIKKGQAQPPTATLPNLRKLTIADVSQFFAVLLSCLRLQPTADVHLISLHHKPAYPTSCRDAFWPFTFRNRANNLLVLTEVTEVAITTAVPEHESEDYILRIAGRGASRGSFTIDLQSTAPLSLAQDVEARYAAVDWALQALPSLFPSRTRMRTIQCTANLDRVQEKNWVGVFQAYPALEELLVDGSGTADLSRLFVVLRWPTQASSVMCQKLRRVAVRGAIYTLAFMEEVERCFLLRHYNSGGAAAQTAFQLGVVVCDYPCSLADRSLDVARLKRYGVDTEISAESAWDIVSAIEQKYAPLDREP